MSSTHLMRKSRPLHQRRHRSWLHSAMRRHAAASHRRLDVLDTFEGAQPLLTRIHQELVIIDWLENANITVLRIPSRNCRASTIVPAIPAHRTTAEVFYSIDFVSVLTRCSTGPCARPSRIHGTAISRWWITSASSAKCAHDIDVGTSVV